MLIVLFQYMLDFKCVSHSSHVIFLDSWLLGIGVLSVTFWAMADAQESPLCLRWDKMYLIIDQSQY